MEALLSFETLVFTNQRGTTSQKTWISKGGIVHIQWRRYGRCRPRGSGGPQNAKICRPPFGTACSSYNRRQNSGSLSRDLGITAIIITVPHLRLSNLWWVGGGGDDVTSGVRTTECKFLCLKQTVRITATWQPHEHRCTYIQQPLISRLSTPGSFSKAPTCDVHVSSSLV
jgi:hypothetical protein